MSKPSKNEAIHMIEILIYGTNIVTNDGEVSVVRRKKRMKKKKKVE